MLSKEQIEDVVDGEITGAVDDITSELSNIVADNLNIAYANIREIISKKYHLATNRPKEVGVQEFLEHLVEQLHHKSSRSHKRLYRDGFNDAIKFIEKIIKEEGKNNDNE